jgi:hypothetical protein
MSDEAKLSDNDEWEPYPITLIATVPEYRRVGSEPTDLNLNEVISHVCDEFQAKSLGAESDDNDYSWGFGFESAADAEKTGAYLEARGFRVEILKHAIRH